MILAAQAQQCCGLSMIIMMKIDLEKNAVEIEIARGVVVTCDRSYVFADASGVQMNK